jgi:hypothetical protein
MTRVTPYQAGDARDPRQRAMTTLALVCWAVPVLVLAAALTYASTGAPSSFLPGLPWATIRATGAAVLFGLGVAFGLVAFLRSAVRNRWAFTFVLLNAVGLIVSGLLVTGPTIAESLHHV